MNNVTYKFNFVGVDACGTEVTFFVKTTEAKYAKCFTSAVRKFFAAYPGGKITRRDSGEMVA